jgi:hypothetical protein
LSLTSVALDAPRYIEVRNLTGIPVSLGLANARSGTKGRQPTRLAAPTIQFYPRG